MLRYLALALAASIAFPLHAQAPSQTGANPLFANDQPLKLTIRAAVDDLMRNRENRNPVQGAIAEADGVSLPARIALRGLTRRTREVCDFAPLRIDFDGEPPQTSAFAGQKRLKLVTHCRTAPGFQQKVLLEYAAYRMYNALTPLSFKVRLADIDYVDPAGRPIVSRVGFFIEDVDDVARRNRLSAPRAGSVIPVNDLSPPDSARYALFQHMIGNHDWSMRAGPAGEECCHNAKLVGSLSPGRAIPVPYDFDFSGLVNAPYATAPDMLGISNVRQRLYRGYCANNAYALGAAQQFRSARPALTAILAATPGMTEPTKSSAQTYLGRFFADIADDRSVSSKVLRTCVK